MSVVYLEDIVIEYNQSDSGPENLDDPFDVKERDIP